MTSAPRAAWAHMRALWPRWTLLPALPFVAWSAFALSIGEWRWEVILFLVGAPLLAYGTPGTKRLLVGAYPLGLVGVLYDAMKFVKDVGVTPARVHTCDLQAFDARTFGLLRGGRAVSWPDLFARHDVLPLDCYCAIPYGTFLFLIAGYGLYLYFKDYDGLRRLAWTFLVVNLAGFVTYHLVPAAPPWYVHAHGCAVDMAARASEGPKLARVDALLGVPYFAGLYGRASDVFGAVPSLHAAYPLMVVFEGWRRHRALGRALALLFFVSMCFSAVYLDHHWVTDVALGVVYASLGYALVRWRIPARAPAPAVRAVQTQAQPL